SSMYLVYLKEIIVFSKTLQEHVMRLKEVFKALRSANITLKPTKCHFLQEKLKFLGHVISENGIEVNPNKIYAISETPVPKSLSKVRSFTAMCSYYRRFIENFSAIARPLIDLTKKDAPFIWSPEVDSAFRELQRKL